MKETSKPIPWHPLWPIAAVSIWIAGVGNLALWRALAAASLLDGPGGWRLAAGLGLAVAAVTAALASLLCWHFALKPALTLFLLLAALGTHFMLSYGVVIDPSMMVNAVQTDLRESLDLLSGRLLLTLALLAGLPAWVLWRWPLRHARGPGQLVLNFGMAMLALGVGALALLAVFQPLASVMRNDKSLRYRINPLNSIYALAVVAAQPLRPAALKFKMLGADAHLGSSYTAQARPPLFVLVVGETARARQFSLNGYDRETNPELAREDVVSLQQVSACGTSTAASLPCMFSHLGREGFADRDANYDNLLDVLQRAGLAVLWLDNQSGCKGVCERVATASTAALADPTLCPGGECLDAALLEGLDDRLAALPEAARARGIVLVLHQMGSHGPAYFKRSPPEYKRFAGECASVSLQDCSRAAVVAAYDNSIVYTDHFLASTIHWLQARAQRYDTALLYVSDHGESLGENNLFLHGLPYAMAPDEQKRVPWIQWTGSGFARRSGLGMTCLRRLAERPLSHDHLFHTLLGTLDVQTAAYRAELDAYAGCRAQTLAAR